MDWIYSTPFYIVLYAIILSSFSISIILSYYSTIVKKPELQVYYDNISNLLNFIAFLLLCIYQYYKKWIFGICFVGVCVIISFTVMILSFIKNK